MRENLVDIALEAARAGGAKAMKYYRCSLDVERKGDGSPLTLADRDSHDAIYAILEKAGIQIVSEESKENEAPSERYWSVDPLDGTKDFLACNDEFSVNIALIENGYPVLGVLYAPALDELYSAVQGQNPFRYVHGVKTEIFKGGCAEKLRMVSSRFHECDEAIEFAQRHAITEMVPMGAALKFARLAAGEADVYPRFVGTSEWDTAAGQIILECGGGQVTDLLTGKRMAYGKKNWRNNNFIACGPHHTAEEFL